MLGGDKRLRYIGNFRNTAISDSWTVGNIAFADVLLYFLAERQLLCFLVFFDIS